MDVRFSLNFDLNHCIATLEEFSCFNSSLTDHEEMSR